MHPANLLYDLFRDLTPLMVRRMAECSEVLSDREKRIVENRYSRPEERMTLRALGEEFGICSSSVSRIVLIAIDKLIQEWSGYLTPMSVSKAALRREFARREGCVSPSEFPRKVRWVSRHKLTPAQEEAFKTIHRLVWGVECKQIIEESKVFRADNPNALADFLKSHPDEFVYVVASSHHYISAVLQGCSFGVVVNHPARRKDGTFKLRAVYHVDSCLMRRVWSQEI